jgi:hypothetical protein
LTPTPFKLVYYLCSRVQVHKDTHIIARSVEYNSHSPSWHRPAFLPLPLLSPGIPIQTHRFFILVTLEVLWKFIQGIVIRSGFKTSIRFLQRIQGYELQMLPVIIMAKIMICPLFTGPAGYETGNPSRMLILFFIWLRAWVIRLRYAD